MNAEISFVNLLNSNQIKSFHAGVGEPGQMKTQFSLTKT